MHEDDKRLNAFLRQDLFEGASSAHISDSVDRALLAVDGGAREYGALAVMLVLKGDPETLEVRVCFSVAEPACAEDDAEVLAHRGKDRHAVQLLGVRVEGHGEAWDVGDDLLKVVLNTVVAFDMESLGVRHGGETQTLDLVGGDGGVKGATIVEEYCRLGGGGGEAGCAGRTREIG